MSNFQYHSATNDFLWNKTKQEKFRPIRGGKLAFFLTNMNFHLFFLLCVLFIFFFLVCIILLQRYGSNNDSIWLKYTCFDIWNIGGVFISASHFIKRSLRLEGLKQWFVFDSFYVYLNLFDRVHD